MESQHSFWTPRRTPTLYRDIQKELSHGWTNHHELIPKFFQLDKDTRARARSAKAEWYRSPSSRWKHVPPKAKTRRKLRIPLLAVLNGILGHYDQIKAREFVDTSSAKLATPRPFPSSPAILLRRRIEGEGPLGYEEGLSCIEVFLEADKHEEIRNRQSGRYLEARERLALHTSGLFCKQPNRRFAYGILISERTLEVYMFDRAGGVCSETLDYHKNSAVFCAILSGISSLQEDSIGFDLTIATDKEHTFIKTRESDDPRGLSYRVVRELYHSDHLLSRGTIVWAVSLAGQGGDLVIKDTWVPSAFEKGKQNEAVLLRRARRKGVMDGIAQLRHYEEIQVGAIMDTVVNNRQMAFSRSAAFNIEKRHVRLVFSTFGVPLDHFTSKLELVAAFHDCVMAHRELYFKAGIIHRDISVGNLLINRGGREGNRGLIIDFDHAMRADVVSRNPPQLVGTLPFISRNVLEGEGPHTYFDDLESFYYVFAYIATSCTGPACDPRHRVRILPRTFAAWQSYKLIPYPESMATSKNTHFRTSYHVVVQPWFGPHVAQLVKGLHGFFARRTHTIAAINLANLSDSEDPDNENKVKQPYPIPNPTADYEEFIQHIRTALVALQTEEGLPPPIPGDIQEAHNNASPKKRKRMAATDRSMGESGRNKSLADEIPLRRSKRLREVAEVTV
ncbi:hypothetical protein K439DRAFT_1629854 [Ramaria rubella]|nr:hypothetical protein K439DRAFT_1629854 [Ramaria rubella]